jgi:hypothetical protein
MHGSNAIEFVVRGFLPGNKGIIETDAPAHAVHLGGVED